MVGNSTFSNKVLNIPSMGLNVHSHAFFYLVCELFEFEILLTYKRDINNQISECHIFQRVYLVRFGVEATFSKAM